MTQSKEQFFYPSTHHISGYIDGVFQEVTRPNDINILGDYNFEKRIPLECGYQIKQYPINGLSAFRLLKLKGVAHNLGLRTRVIFSDEYLEKERANQQFSFILDGQGTMRFFKNKWHDLKVTLWSTSSGGVA